MTDSIQVISWNILNPDPDFVKMSLRTFLFSLCENKNCRHYKFVKRIYMYLL